MSSIDLKLQGLFTGCALLYLTIYAMESLVRYSFNLVGLSELIFLRDALILGPLLFLLIYQLAKKRLHPAFWIFGVIMAIHGLIMIFNIGSVTAVIYNVKVMMTLLFGAIAASALLAPSRKVLFYFFGLWIFSILTVFLDKYIMAVPWSGIGTTEIGGLEVEISRDWEISGPDKRAGGWMRSSINAAIMIGSLSLILMLNTLKFHWKAIIALVGLVALYMTTQKGAMLAYFIIVGTYFAGYASPVFFLRLILIFFILLAISFPIILPYYDMPAAEGVFSLYSFNLRVEDMWPDAWAWIRDNEIFPFGVGLGGIGGGQRFYALENYNATDNIFVYMYGNFGVMAFIYLGYIIFQSLRLKSDTPRETRSAMAIMAFMMGYGIVLSMIEDQMSSIMIGAALASITYHAQGHDKGARHESA